MQGSPEFIWIKMLKRPCIAKNDKNFALQGKFNNTLESVLVARKTSCIPAFIMSIEVDQEEFLPNGELTSTGKCKNWQEIDSYIQKFERNEINLKPKQSKKDGKKRKSAKPSRLQDRRLDKNYLEIVKLVFDMC